MPRYRCELLAYIFICFRAGVAYKILWNSPYPTNCPVGSREAPNFSNFGILTNTGNAFNGNVVWTIYCPAHFKTFPHFRKSESGKLVSVNGGIPQRGNMTVHLAEVRKDIENLFPDKDFSGYAVIDWEVWYPWLIIASDSLYVNESLSYVRDLHPTWPENEVEQEAVRSWNISSKRFMVETLKLCKSLRPKAKWGYYGRPGCYTGLNKSSTPPACIESVQARNDALEDLWKAGSALYPSVYIGPNSKYPFLRTPAFVQGEILETRRIREKFGLKDYEIIAFTWYDLFNGTDVSNWLPMTNQTDLSTEFDTPKASLADGIIVWGSSADVSTPARCNNMKDYVNSTLGPKLAKLLQTQV